MTACLSNMRQIGTGMNMYLQDYDETLPAADWGNAYTGPPYTVFGFQTGAGSGAPTWADVFQPYLKNTKVLKCPSDGSGNPVVSGSQIPGEPMSYGLNYYFYRTLSGFRGNSNGGTLAEIQAPASKIYVAEVQSNKGIELVRPDRYDGLIRHRAGGSYLYVDGHTKWHKMPTQWSAGGVAWNDPMVAQAQPFPQWIPWVDAPESW